MFLIKDKKVYVSEGMNFNHKVASFLEVKVLSHVDQIHFFLLFIFIPELYALIVGKF